MIRLQEVNQESFWFVTKLKVGEKQSDFIESNAQSIAESKFYDFWKPVCIYDDDIMIGFAMYGQIVKEDNRVWLDRFMIDEKYQGKGLGKKALKYILTVIEEEYSCNKIYLSIFENNKNALAMYKKEGFEFNGELDYGGEKVMVKNLR